MDTYNNSLTELYIRTICRLIVEQLVFVWNVISVTPDIRPATQLSDDKFAGKSMTRLLAGLMSNTVLMTTGNEFHADLPKTKALSNQFNLIASTKHTEGIIQKGILEFIISNRFKTKG